MSSTSPIRRTGRLAAIAAAALAAAGIVAALMPAAQAAAGAIPSGPVASAREARSAGGSIATGDAKTVVRHGVDVSHWQQRIRWERVARAGIDFAIVKATEGTAIVDPTYRRNAAGARRAGIAVAAYHFADPSGRRGDARREAEHFVRTARLRGSDLVPALDLERDGGLGAARLERWTLDWLQRVHALTGVRPALYTSPSFWSAQLGGSARIARQAAPTLWVAHWDTRRPVVPQGGWAGSGWTFWQWTDRGRVPGIGGHVDRDVYSGPPLASLMIGRQRAADRGRDERSARSERDRRAGGSRRGISLAPDPETH